MTGGTSLRLLWSWHFAPRAINPDQCVCVCVSRDFLLWIGQNIFKACFNYIFEVSVLSVHHKNHKETFSLFSKWMEHFDRYNLSILEIIKFSEMFRIQYIEKREST